MLFIWKHEQMIQMFVYGSDSEKLPPHWEISPLAPDIVTASEAGQLISVNPPVTYHGPHSTPHALHVTPHYTRPRYSLGDAGCNSKIASLYNYQNQNQLFTNEIQRRSRHFPAFLGTHDFPNTRLAHSHSHAVSHRILHRCVIKLRAV